MRVKYVHSCVATTHLEGIPRTRYVAFSCWLDVVHRRPLVSAPAARSVLHSGVSVLLELAEADARLLSVGRDDCVHTGEKTPGELNAIPVPVDECVQAVAAVRLPVGAVSAEA